MRARQFISAIFALWSRGGALQLAAIMFGFVGNPLLSRVSTAFQFFHELRRAYARTCGAVSPSLYGGTTEAHRTWRYAARDSLAARISSKSFVDIASNLLLMRSAPGDKGLS